MFHVITEKNGVQRPWMSTQTWGAAASEARIMRTRDSRIVCEPGCGHCDDVAKWNAAQEANKAPRAVA